MNKQGKIKNRVQSHLRPPINLVYLKTRSSSSLLFFLYFQSLSIGSHWPRRPGGKDWWGRKLPRNFCVSFLPRYAVASSVNHRQSQEKVQIINSHPSYLLPYERWIKWQPLASLNQLFSTNHDGVEKFLHNSRNFYPPHHFIMNTCVVVWDKTNIQMLHGFWNIYLLTHLPNITLLRLT